MAFFWYDNNTETGDRAYFKGQKLTKDGIKHNYIISKKLTDKKYTHIKGFILNYTSQDIEWSHHAEVSNVRINLKSL